VRCTNLLSHLSNQRNSVPVAVLWLAIDQWIFINNLAETKMKNRFHYDITRFTSNPRKLFLVDGIGAGLTAFFLAAVLANFPPVFGMPSSILYTLSIVALAYALYSLCCYFFLPVHWRPYLLLIIVANFFYMLLTIGVVFYFSSELTVLGWIYFLLELTIMICLLLLERKVLQWKEPKNSITS
jgi:hypothetical protein